VAENTLTQDPRIAELLEHRGELSPDGEPTRRAVMAEKARRHLDDVERLRAELHTVTREADELETRLANREAFEADDGEHKEVLVDQLIDVRTQAALSSSSGISAGLRRQYREKRAQLKEYDRDTEEERTRVEMIRQAALDKAREVKQIRESISRRLAVLDSFLDSADTAGAARETASAPSAGRIRHLANAPTTGRVRRPTRRVVRRIRRRR